MTEEELIAWLIRVGRTPETIQSIVEGTSVDAVQRQFQTERGRAASSDEAEHIARIWRKDFVEGINVLEAGGAILEHGTDSYMKRSDFPPET